MGKPDRIEISPDGRSKMELTAIGDTAVEVVVYEKDDLTGEWVQTESRTLDFSAFVGGSA